MRPFHAALLCLFGAAATAAAQSRSDIAAAVSLQFTPIASLPPFATSTIQAEVQHGAALGIRYGYLSRSGEGADANNLGISAILPVGLGASVSLTAGFFALTCNECDPGLMLGLGADRRLGSLVLGSGRDGSRLQFALNGELGYGQPQGTSLGDGSAMSGMVGLPISLISGSRNRDEMRIVPFVTPGFGFGTISGGDSPSGAALMIGGGVGIYNRSSSLAFNFGFQHVAVRDAGTMVGIGLVLGGR